MKTIIRKHALKFRRQHHKILAVCILFFMMFPVSRIFAQKSISVVSATYVPAVADTTRKLFGGKITNYGFGGLALKFTSFNNRLAIMTGGRGACTINNRFTIGGGGYGTANSIRIWSPNADTARNFKMGYGGLEIGYIFLPGGKVNFGGSLLIAAGAAFWQSKPKSDVEKIAGNDFTIFPVLELPLYSEISLNRFMRLNAGISYRYISGAGLTYMKDQNMRGFSCWVGLLFGKS
jgi:hypothetical protein